MNQVHFGKKGLEVTHQKFMNMIQWDAPPPNGIRFTPARACPINQGVLGSDGDPLPTPAFIYVDDFLISGLGSRTKRALLACLEAIFVVMGRPEESLQQCPLALDKWMDLKVVHEVTILGLCFNSSNMTVSIKRD